MVDLNPQPRRLNETIEFLFSSLLPLAFFNEAYLSDSDPPSSTLLSRGPLFSPLGFFPVSEGRLDDRRDPHFFSRLFIAGHFPSFRLWTCTAHFSSILPPSFPRKTPLKQRVLGCRTKPYLHFSAGTRTCSRLLFFCRYQAEK